jgi:D-hydroxyproline dehydrogenase subunit gamma
MLKDSTTSTTAFKLDQTPTETVSVLLDGKTVELPKGVSIAAGLLSIGEIISRISPSAHKPRSPHCLMGVCYECLMEINGVERQACMTDPKEGMVINRHLNSKGEDA